MNCHCIRHNEIPNSTRLFTDFLYDFPRVSEFYAYNPFEEESYSKAVQSVRYDNDLRRSVAAVLREQNQRFSANQKTLDNLSRLETPGCVAVVTGHQVGLFSGPAFGLYKGLTAVKLAHTLSNRGIPAVPVFWLATEDHDLEEVNHCFVQDREGNPQRLDYHGKAPVLNASVGSLSLTDEILPLIDQLRIMLPDSPTARETVESLAECYRPGETLGKAFGSFMARVFADYGVIMIDPKDRQLHKLSARVFQTAIESAPAIRDDLVKQNGRLAEGGYHAQVHVAENFSLLFLHVDGQRRALRLRDRRLVTSQGDSFLPGELLSLLEQQPEAVSANALLRPVMQDALLPTVAYVGGPSELAYLAQAGAVYRRILGRMPVVFPRASMTILDNQANRILSKYDVTITDVMAGKQSLREKMAARMLPNDVTEVFRKAASNLEADLQAVQASLAKLDPTLVDAAANSGRKMQYQLSALEHKAASAIQNRSEQIERDAGRMENTIYPSKTPQERLYSGISLLARYGPRFLSDLYDQIPIHSAQHQVIEL